MGDHVHVTAGVPASVPPVQWSESVAGGVVVVVGAVVVDVVGSGERPPPGATVVWGLWSVGAGTTRWRVGGTVVVVAGAPTVPLCVSWRGAVTGGVRAGALCSPGAGWLTSGAGVLRPGSSVRTWRG